jgi:uncharacterized membrane protein
MKKSPLKYARELFETFEVPEYGHADEDWTKETKEVVQKVLTELISEAESEHMMAYYLEVIKELDTVEEEVNKEARNRGGM